MRSSGTPSATRSRFGSSETSCLKPTATRSSNFAESTRTGEVTEGESTTKGVTMGDRELTRIYPCFLLPRSHFKGEEMEPADRHHSYSASEGSRSGRWGT